MGYGGDRGRGVDPTGVDVSYGGEAMTEDLEQKAREIVKTLRPTDPDSWEPNVLYVLAVLRDVREAYAKVVPTNWLDPLLTGPNAVLGKGPYGNREIEALLRGIQDRIRNQGVK